MWKSVMRAGALLALVASAEAQAQVRDSTGWTVTGTITPPPCVLTLSGGGVADFGTRASTTVQGWTAQADPLRYSGIDANVFQSLNLHVACSTATRFALSIVDNRASTVSGPAGQGYSFGLGSYTAPGGSATNIGRYVVRYNQLTVKQASAAPAVRPAKTLLTDGAATSSSSWTIAAGADATYLPSGKSVGFSVLGLLSQPDPLVDVSGPIEFAFEPLKSVVDTATSDIVLDGSATVTLVGL